MRYIDPDMLLRKERVGWIAALAWAVVLSFPHVGAMDSVPIFTVIAWISTTYWVALDSRYRGMNVFWWTVFTIVVQPIALLIFFLSRPRIEERCHQCGMIIYSDAPSCPACGYRSIWKKVSAKTKVVCDALSQSVSDSSVDHARELARSIAIACAALGAFGLVFSRTSPSILSDLAFAGYWVLLAWWVYLDATWRRMNPIPWAGLTLVTNVFGLVAYLVVRHPDPQVCSHCGAVLGMSVKCCPFCGSAMDLVCPVCQSSIRPGWVYCPECATKLPQGDEPSSVSDQGRVTALSIRGTVVDAKTARPISGAVVKIDSKTNICSATTDEMGRFVLSGLEVRPYVLAASADGYDSQAQSFVPGPNVAKPLIFGLYPLEDPVCF